MATVTTSTYTPVTGHFVCHVWNTIPGDCQECGGTYFTAAGNLLHYSYTVTNNGGYPLAGPITVAMTKWGP